MKKSIVLFIIFLYSSQLLAGETNNTNSAKNYYTIKISISQCRLWLYEENGSGKILIKEYPAGTTKNGLKEYPLGHGTVTAIEIEPIWYPTAYTRHYFAIEKGIFLPQVVPPGHSQNYMGKFKISLSHFVPGKGRIYRIHGVRKGDESYVGKRVSGGCVRMFNDEGLELVRKISIGTPVEIVY